MSTTPPSLDRTRTFLKNSTFFGNLSDAALDVLVRKGHTKKYAKNGVVCRRGDPGDSMMIILSGLVKITNTMADGKEIVLSFLGIGDLAGEIAVLDGRERTANVVAIEDAEVFVIHRRDVLPVLNTYPAGMLEVIEILCEKLRAASLIIEDSTCEMQARGARGLLRLAQQHGVKIKEGIRIDLNLSQTDLGNYLGLSRANVSRLLTHLRGSGVITMEGNKIIITDENDLVAASEQMSEADRERN